MADRDQYDPFPFKSVIDDTIITAENYDDYCSDLDAATQEQFPHLYKFARLRVNFELDELQSQGIEVNEETSIPVIAHLMAFFEGILSSAPFSDPRKLEWKIGYKQYITSDKWKMKADAARERAGHRCQVCNRQGGRVILDVHHRTYERLYNEAPEDLTVLCRDCHSLYEKDKKHRRKK